MHLVRADDASLRNALGEIPSRKFSVLLLPLISVERRPIGGFSRAAVRSCVFVPVRRCHIVREEEDDLATLRFKINSQD